MAAAGNDVEAVAAAAVALPGGGGGGGSASPRLAELLGGERPLVGIHSDKGVHSWRAAITIDKKSVDLGVFFESRAQAAAAYDIALIWVKRHKPSDGELSVCALQHGQARHRCVQEFTTVSMCDAACRTPPLRTELY